MKYRLIIGLLPNFIDEIKCFILNFYLFFKFLFPNYFFSKCFILNFLGMEYRLQPSGDIGLLPIPNFIDEIKCFIMKGSWTPKETNQKDFKPLILANPKMPFIDQNTKGNYNKIRINHNNNNVRIK